MKNNQIILRDIATIKFGVYIKPIEKGEIIYLQAKNYDNLGCLLDNGSAFLGLNNKNKEHLLQDGDILFVGKGFRNFAWVYHSFIGPAIASSIFYVIRCDKEKVNPNYMATLFNTQKYQGQFQNLAAGSSIPSIRKAELESLSIDLPSLVLQQKIAELNVLHVEDIKLSNRVIELKKAVFENVINRILK